MMEPTHVTAQMESTMNLALILVSPVIKCVQLATELWELIAKAVLALISMMEPTHVTAQTENTINLALILVSSVIKSAILVMVVPKMIAY